MNEPKPGAVRVAEVLCRPIDPWDPETAAALEADMDEFRKATELYPGQAYFHKYNPRIRDAEVRFRIRQIENESQEHCTS